MRQDIWGKKIMGKGFMQVPRVLMAHRAELGLNNNEYAVLLDYLSYYAYTGSTNPYSHLARVNGKSERAIQSVVRSLEKKGLIERDVLRSPGNRVNGVVFRPGPLVSKLEALMKKASPHVGEDALTGVGEETFGTYNEDIYNIYNINNKAVTGEGSSGQSDGLKERNGAAGERDSEGGFREAGGQRYEGGAEEAGQCGRTDTGKGAASGGAGDGGAYPNPGKPAKSDKPASEKKWKDPFSPVRWYNEVFSVIYEERAGQPVLTGGREYKSAVTYFSRLRQLNPELTPEDIYARAGEGAVFMLDSQLSGGAFGWLAQPPDICMLASQAQNVDYHLRRLLSGEGVETSSEDGDKRTVVLEFKHKEAGNEGAYIEKLLGELGEIERVSFTKPGGAAHREHALGSGPSGDERDGGAEPPPGDQEEG